MIILDDLANPASGFTTAQYDSIGLEIGTIAYPEAVKQTAAMPLVIRSVAASAPRHSSADGHATAVSPATA